VARECERLLLTEVRPNEGWNVNTREEETDEIEVEFGRGNTGGSSRPSWTTARRRCMWFKKEPGSSSTEEQ